MKLHTILFSTFCNVGYSFSHLLLFFIYLHMQPKFLLFLVGPSYCIDTACSSSLLALDHALAAMRSGLCQAAIVAGCNLCLKPSMSTQFDRLSKLSTKSLFAVHHTCIRYYRAIFTTVKQGLLLRKTSLLFFTTTCIFGHSHHLLKTNVVMPCPGVLDMLAADGTCRSFDAAGSGYVRSEAVVAIYLQLESNAKRIYATVVHAKNNCDGSKENGKF